MTDRDNIELPPEWLTIPAIQAWADARARDAVIAAIDLHDKRTAELRDELYDLKTELARCRKERDAARAEPAKPAEPEAHRARLILSPKGYAWTVGPVGKDCFTADIRWTDDGRAWIDSERNRELAQWLRMWRGAIGNEAADALDGGVR